MLAPLSAVLLRSHSPAFQAECRRVESRLPLHIPPVRQAALAGSDGLSHPSGWVPVELDLVPLQARHPVAKSGMLSRIVILSGRQAVPLGQQSHPEIGSVAQDLRLDLR